MLFRSERPNAQAFFADFKFTIRNHFHFNPADTPINLVGIKLQRLFDEKWNNLPNPSPGQPTMDDMAPDPGSVSILPVSSEISWTLVAGI